MPWDFGTFTVVLTEKASFQSGNRTNSSLVTANRPELEVETITDDAKQKLKFLSTMTEVVRSWKVSLTTQ
jgi:hypothetical protein